MISIVGRDWGQQQQSCLLRHRLGQALSWKSQKVVVIISIVVVIIIIIVVVVVIIMFVVVVVVTISSSSSSSYVLRPKPAARQHGGHGSGIRRLACRLRVGCDWPPRVGCGPCQQHAASPMPPRVVDCDCYICKRRLGPGPEYRSGKCGTCYDDITRALRSALRSGKCTTDDKLAYMWVYFGLGWSACRDCQNIMRMYTTVTGSADSKTSATDKFPRGPRHHPGVSVTLSATGEVVTLAPTYQLSLIRIVYSA